MPVEKFWSSLKPTANFATFIGNPGEIFFDPSNGNMRISDGVTLGGLPLSVGDVVGISHVEFDTTHVPSGNEPIGTLSWNQADNTLNIYHPNGVVQQVGHELYAYVINNTGATITNGTVSRFSGAHLNGEARLEVAMFQADGTYPSLYTIGVATEDILDGGAGRITVWGNVRDINTTGSLYGETWTTGDILYCSPSVSGGLTKVKPRAPNNVVPIAVVLSVNATTGEIFIRPTIEQKRSYGSFSRTTNATIAVINTAYAISFDTIETSNGVSLVGGFPSRLQVDQSGLYTIYVSSQVNANTGGGFTGGTVYLWFRVNGVDVDNSMRRQGALGAAPANSFNIAQELLLDANDYIEIMYTGDDIRISFEASGATLFGPSTSAMLVSISQSQL